ncbi:MAG: hypothetical protein JOZ27_07560, partial [Caulobacteraceae bacterium]|nr:hypothetical protein [Caulobacteraceae bacterium]
MTEGRASRAIGYLRANAWTIVREAAINFVAPWLIYNLAKHQLGDVRALIASSA